ncbi:unnamed protein product [Peronospora destructor]|uniref:Bromo domain-containing protein n=1 Tax=Peronospora destructor TaxID=86335 RepID=A0AAV0VCZ1_9STRA|nr:unnamed protein product [Peronospora destructor]
MISEAAHAECVRLLELLTNARVQESWSWVFMTPVDIPGYEKVIKRPMDLGTITKNLGSKPSRCRFKSHEKFARDVRMVFNNALVYNKDDRDVKGSVYAAAQHLLRVFETAYAKSIDNVFKADDMAKAAYREAKEEKRRADEKQQDEEKKKREDTSSLMSSSLQYHNTSKHNSHSYREKGEERSKHKHKKDKKSKKSKKKSKERDKDREHRHSSSSSGESKKKSHRNDRKMKVAAPSTILSKDAVVEHAPVVSRNDVVPPASSISAPPQSNNSVVKQEPALSNISGVKMSDAEVMACLSLLMKLIKYKEGNISPAAPFLQPVDVTHFPDYRVKVPNRMHLYGVQKKLRSGSYATINAFAHDMRLIFSNCLVYNSDVVLSKVMRNHAVTLIQLFENQFAKIGGSWPGVPERWKCHQIIHEILAHRTDGQETAQWFKYPIESYYDSPDQIPYNYYETVKKAMDIGTVSSRLHLGKYKHASEFVADMKLVFDNCIQYWKPDPQGHTYCKSAETLLQVLHTRSALFSSSSSTPGVSKKQRSSLSSVQSMTVPAGLHGSSSQKSAAPVISVSGSEHEAIVKKTSSSKSLKVVKVVKVVKVSKSSKSSKSRESSGGLLERDTCLGIMKQLRGHKMKGYGGIEIKTAGPFLTAVDTTKYADYLTIVSEPMDFAKIERKLKSDRYGSVDEFSADVHLIFSNCHKYNSDPVEGADIRAMATNLRSCFVKLCNDKLGPLNGMVNEPTHMPIPSTQIPSSLPSSVAAIDSKSAAPAPIIESKAGTEVTGTGPSFLHKPTKKPPAHSPTKTPVSASSVATFSIASSACEPKKDMLSNNSRKVVDSAVAATLAPAVSLEPLVEVKAVPTSILAIGKEVPHDSGTNLAGLNPQEARRLRKEMKEKRKKEKKEKKEKKKKDKEKKREKKEKRERSKVSGSAPQESGSVAQESSSPVTAPPNFASTTAAPAQALLNGGAAGCASKIQPTVSATASAAIASKRGLVEPHLASGLVTNKKSKKYKKSDLISWEVSCGRVLNRLGKIEQVAKLHFNHPLLEVFPQLAGEYTSLITEPMDLRTLREQLHTHALTQVEFLRKGRLMFLNAIKFNFAKDPASIQVRDMSAHLLWYFDSLCAELQIYPTPEEESRVKRDQLRHERAEFVNTVPVELKAKECQKLLRVLNSQKYDKYCWPFRKSVRELFPSLSPDYFDVIKTPMDLSTIAEKLNEFEYKTHGEFIRDLRLTFENAMVYNSADKDREGWSVYSAAAHMLAAVGDLWGDVTLEVTEKTRRRELLHKERMNESKRKRSDTSDVSDREKKAHRHHYHRSDDSEFGGHTHYHKSSKQVAEEAVVSAETTAMTSTSKKSTAPGFTATSVVGTIVVGGGSGSRDDAGASDATATRVKLQLLPNRPNMERMNKQERKAEEKRRKRARREEEMARTEKRRRTAVAATDDALREAEIRSRRKLQKLEIAEAVRLRKERERRAAEEEAERAHRVQMKLNAAAWTGVLVPAPGTTSSKRTGFWAKKHTKLQTPTAFQPPAINA